jgi:hypothetical protein
MLLAILEKRRSQQTKFRLHAKKNPMEKSAKFSKKKSKK